MTRRKSPFSNLPRMPSLPKMPSLPRMPHIHRCHGDRYNEDTQSDFEEHDEYADHSVHYVDPLDDLEENVIIARKNLLLAKILLIILIIIPPLSEYFGLITFKGLDLFYGILVCAAVGGVYILIKYVDVKLCERKLRQRISVRQEFGRRH